MPTPYTPETLSRIAILQQKAKDNTLTMDDMREGVRLMRGDRKSAASASEAGVKRRAMAKAVIPSADEMLDELEGLK